MKGNAMANEAKSGRNTSALMKPLTPQGPLAAVVGSDPLPRGQVVAKVWDYIRANNLQKPTDKRVIIADAKLKPIFGKDEATMFEMNKFIAQYLK
jgi:chromatin remodeling complex protein RSC6